MKKCLAQQRIITTVQFNKIIKHKQIIKHTGIKYGMCVCMLSHFSGVQHFVTPWTVARQARLSMGFSRQEYCSELSLVTQLCPKFVTLWTSACQDSLSITNSQSLLKLMSTETAMPSNHFSLCGPLLLSPSTFPSTRVFYNESVP